jgi:SNF2 family DNA or RNA helicase
LLSGQCLSTKPKSVRRARYCTVYLFDNTKVATNAASLPEQQAMTNLEFQGIFLWSDPAGELRPHQVHALEFFNQCEVDETKRACLCADIMGAGKTVQILSLVAHRIRHSSRTLIVVTSQTLLQWLQQAKQFLPGFKVDTS